MKKNVDNSQILELDPPSPSPNPTIILYTIYWIAIFSCEKYGSGVNFEI